jgi:hypothetical protein
MQFQRIKRCRQNTKSTELGCSRFHCRLLQVSAHEFDKVIRVLVPVIARHDRSNSNNHATRAVRHLWRATLRAQHECHKRHTFVADKALGTCADYLFSSRKSCARCRITICKRRMKQDRRVMQSQARWRGIVDHIMLAKRRQNKALQSLSQHQLAPCSCAWRHEEGRQISVPLRQTCRIQVQARQRRLQVQSSRLPRRLTCCPAEK